MDCLRLFFVSAFLITRTLDCHSCFVFFIRIDDTQCPFYGRECQQNKDFAFNYCPEIVSRLESVKMEMNDLCTGYTSPDHSVFLQVDNALPVQIHQVSLDVVSVYKQILTVTWVKNINHNWGFKSRMRILHKSRRQSDLQLLSANRIAVSSRNWLVQDVGCIYIIIASTAVKLSYRPSITFCHIRHSWTAYDQHCCCPYHLILTWLLQFCSSKYHWLHRCVWRMPNMASHDIILRCRHNSSDVHLHKLCWLPSHWSIHSSSFSLTKCVPNHCTLPIKSFHVKALCLSEISGPVHPKF